MQNLREKEFDVFIQKITDVYREALGYQQFGEYTEYYDEDGVILMTATESYDQKQISFNFGYSAELDAEDIYEAEFPEMED